MSIDKIMNNPEVDTVGATSLVSAFFMYLWQCITTYGNDILISATGILGFLYLILKFRIALLELRQKKRDEQKSKLDEDKG